MVRNNVKEREKRKELPEDVSQGVREMTDYEKAVAENQPVKTPKETPQFDQESGGVLGDIGRAAGREKERGGVGGFATNLVAAPFRAAERLSLELLDAIGVGTDPQIEDARAQLGLGSGNILTDPDVIDLGLTVGTAGIGRAIGAFAKSGKAVSPGLKRFTSLSKKARTAEKGGGNRLRVG